VIIFIALWLAAGLFTVSRMSAKRFPVRQIIVLLGPIVPMTIYGSIAVLGLLKFLEDE